MIIRIVRMTFREEEVNSFLEIFDSSREKIRAFDGCTYLSLHQDHHAPHIFYTLSHWETAGALEAYRRSALFKTTWARTKRLFEDQPQAFSLVSKQELK